MKFKPVKTFKKRKKKILKNFVKPVTKSDLLGLYQKLGIKAGDIVFVHSALSTFGKVDGGPQVIIDTLLETVEEEGTLLFPGFNLTKSMADTMAYYAAGEAYDYQDSTPTTGIICRVFKQEYDPCISIHPTHSVLAKGKLAQVFTSEHHLADSSFGKGTPLYKLLSHNAKIIGLGSSFGRLTFVHVIEDVVNNFPINVYKDQSYKVRLIDNEGNTIQKTFVAHCPQNSRIDHLIKGSYIRRKFWNTLRQRKQLKTHKVNQARSWAINARDLYNLQEELAQEKITIYTEPKGIFKKITYKFLGLLDELNS
ncbi:AAC(3) family N-acetyltransferase [uncultured Microscilla sp.]|uniref:AAC(3) family N-acetyltransferase n=1 Tax=uncultured Microscilla sp. TaxID=432653 RepID=UPI002622A651|nr:AAC(3) family N-acetyltransferase [uncultured Microscilla sp.]